MSVFFKAGSSLLIYGYHIFFANGYLGQFHFCALVNGTTINIAVQVALWSTGLTSFIYMLRSVWLGHKVILVVVFREPAPVPSTVAVPTLQLGGGTLTS